MITDKVYKVPCIYPIQNPEKKQEVLKVKVPGSKSITNRALLLATLAEGKTVLKGVLFSDDSRHFLKCIQELGFETVVDEENCIVEVTGHGGKVPKQEAFPYVGSAGTAARFLSAYLGVCNGVYHMDASEQMRKRPMAPLLESLRELGCQISYEGREGYFPFTLRGNGFGKDTISVDIEHSSQFLSALLIASSLADQDMHIQVVGTHGMAYIEMTISMMAQFGVQVKKQADGSYVIPAGQKYHGGQYQIEPDMSAASYFYAMVPLLGIPVQVGHITYQSLQGDIAFLSVLEKMGCSVKEDSEGLIVYPPKAVEEDGISETDAKYSAGFPGIDIDMSSFSDQAITVAAIAPFATSLTRIRGIGHIRFQECDRMSAIVTELGKMGIRCDCTESEITIYPGEPGASLVETYDDHRVAMGFSLIGLRADGIQISNPGCCKKTFENYFECLDACVDKIVDKKKI